jgi:hypothetical protein
VRLVFHTYHGVLLWVVQTKHRFRLPPDQARELLWRLHCFNLKWGLLAYLGFVVPLLSYLNYLAQKRSITRQEREADAAERYPEAGKATKDIVKRGMIIGFLVGLLGAVTLGSFFVIDVLLAGQKPKPEHLEALLGLGVILPVLGVMFGFLIGRGIDVVRKLFGPT